MHKVWNFGSALQAYATQRVIEDLGYDCELIDYVYPNVEHLAYQNIIRQVEQLTTAGILRLIAQRVKAKITRKKENLFEKFYSSYFKCSETCYSTRCQLESAQPKYDIYVTGSDQVWNPKYIGYDTNFFLEFAPSNSKKISYASSFSSSEISPIWEKHYSEKLKQYSMISVREQAAKSIVERMTGKSVEVVCDPTLLLTSDDWTKLARTSIFKTEEKFILVYLMGYAYNPYPEIFNYVERVADKLKLPLIWLNAKQRGVKRKHKEIHVPSWGPCEVLYLISKAEYVITDSFHGTAFSINFDRPFISCVKSLDNSDSRILDLLREIGAEEHAVVYNKCDNIPFTPITHDSHKALNEYRNRSISFLKNALNGL